MKKKTLQSTIAMLCIPSKSPSLMVRILFSCISSLRNVSNMDKARCGTDVSSFPPKFSRLSFLQNHIKMEWGRFKRRAQRERPTAEYTHFSRPRNASGSMTLILFSYNVNISSVSRPSNALLWICEMRLWLTFNINR